MLHSFFLKQINFSVSQDTSSHVSCQSKLKQSNHTSTYPVVADVLSRFEELQYIINYAKLSASQSANEKFKMLQQGNTGFRLKQFQVPGVSYKIWCDVSTDIVHHSPIPKNSYIQYLSQEQTAPLN